MNFHKPSAEPAGSEVQGNSLLGIIEKYIKTPHSAGLFLCGDIALNVWMGFIAFKHKVLKYEILNPFSWV